MEAIRKSQELALMALWNINKIDDSNGKILLKNISIEIKKEDFTLIRYKDNSEGMALANIIAGFDQLYTGYYYLLGYYLHALSDTQLTKLRQESIGFIFKENKFFYHINVYDNIYHSFLHNNKDKNKIKDNINYLLGYMDIDKLYRKRIKELSTVELLKLALVRALVKKPKCIIAHYPVDNLFKEDFYFFTHLLFKVYKKFTIPIILITSNYEIKMEVNRVIEINSGELSYDKET